MYCFLNFHLVRLPLYLWVQSLNCVPLCKPLDCSPPCSCIHVIFQARILEWVAISFPRGSSQPKDWTQFSCISFIGSQILYHWATLFFLFSHKSCPALCDPMNCSTPDFPVLHYLLQLLKFMFIKSVMPSNHLILCHRFYSRLQSFPASGSFPMSQLCASGGQSIGASASASILPNEYSGLISFRIDWFDLAVRGTLKRLL